MAISGWLGFPCNNNETEDGHDWESTLCSWGKSMKILPMLGVPAMFLLILILSASRSSSQSVSWSPAVNPLAPSPWTFGSLEETLFLQHRFAKKIRHKPVLAAVNNSVSSQETRYLRWTVLVVFPVYSISIYLYNTHWTHEIKITCLMILKRFLSIRSNHHFRWSPGEVDRNLQRHRK